jgi:hypothetical protein
MGATQTIEQKQQEDAKFRAFMDDVRKASDVELDRLRSEMIKQAKSHYEENGWDHARLCGDAKSDYQNYDDWGLERINKIITAIGSALSKGDYPSNKVPGSNHAEKSTIDKAKEFAGVFAGDYTLIVARVQAIVSTFISQFATVSEAKQDSSMSDMPLAGGLHLFTATSGRTYRREEFFSRQFIGSFQIVFSAYMSVDEARAIGLTQILRTTELELNFINGEILAIREAQAKSLAEIRKSDIKDYISTKATYSEIVDSLKADREKLMLEFEKYKGVERTLDHFIARDMLSPTPGGLNSFRLEDLFPSTWEADVARRLLASR